MKMFVGKDKEKERPVPSKHFVKGNLAGTDGSRLHTVRSPIVWPKLDGFLPAYGL